MDQHRAQAVYVSRVALELVALVATVVVWVAVAAREQVGAQA